MAFEYINIGSASLLTLFTSDKRIKHELKTLQIEPQKYAANILNSTQWVNKSLSDLKSYEVMI